MGDEGGSFMMAFVFSLLFYFLFAWVVSRIGNKFGVGTFGEWCIPIYNMVLMFRCAGMSGWNLLWFLVPIANIIVTCVVWAKIAVRLGKSPVLYVIMIIFIPVVPLLIMAFDNSMPSEYS